MTAVYHSVAETAPSRYTAPPTTADVLHRAADLLEEFGWVRGARGVPGNEDFDRDNGYCILGAVHQASLDLGCGDERPAYFYVPDLLGDAPLPPERHDMTPGGPWWRWNDTLGRTKEQVVAKLREAAGAAE